MKQLNCSPGLIGYSLRTSPLKLSFWRLSVWDGEDSLRDFIRESPHVDVTRRFRPQMSGFWIGQCGRDAANMAAALTRLPANAS